MVAHSRRAVVCGLVIIPLAAGRAVAAGAPANVALSDFGGDPSRADNGPAFTAALTVLRARGGGVLAVGAGTYRIDSAALGHRGIALPSGVTLRGAGRRETSLVVTGGASSNLFVAINQQRIAFEDMALIGNNVASAPGYGSGAAIRWVLDAAAATHASGFVLRRVHLDNFRGACWIDIENQASPSRALEMRAVTLDAVSFTSRPGNAIAPAKVTHNSAAVCINGYSGAVRDVRVNGLEGDARHIKSGIILYNQVIGATLSDVVVRNAGVEGATDDAGAYAIQIYDSVGTMRAIAVERPVITSPRSVGIYVANGADVSIRDAAISGQTDRQAGTLPKGAIAFNGTRGWKVSGGTLRNNWCDLAIVPHISGRPGHPARIDGTVEGTDAQGARNGILISYGAGAVGAGVVFRRCRWQSAGPVLSVQNSGKAFVAGRAGGWIDDIALEDCELVAGEGSRAIDLWAGSGSPAGGYSITRCRLVGSNPLYARAMTGALKVVGCTITDLGTTPGASAATFIDCPRLELADCVVASPGREGIGVTLTGSAGSVRGMRFGKVARRIPTSGERPQLGGGMPAFAGAPGQFVQDLRSGSDPDAGWVCVDGRSWNVRRPAS